jgi:hypothetical protein
VGMCVSEEADSMHKWTNVLGLLFYKVMYTFLLAIIYWLVCYAEIFVDQFRTELKYCESDKKENVIYMIYINIYNQILFSHKEK